MKGDRVEIVIDAGETSRTYEVMATRAGRRVEVVTGRGVVQVMEVTRGGTVVRTARFMASRVIAVVEHPARGEGADNGRRAGSADGRERAGPGTRVPAGEGGEGGEAVVDHPAAEPAGAARPASMLEDAVDRTASQLG